MTRAKSCPTLRWFVAAAWCSTLASGAVACGTHSEVVFTPLTVEFAEPTSSSSEAVSEASIAVRLSAPHTEPVSVDVIIEDIDVSGHDDCGTRDYSVASQTLVFEPGQLETSVELFHLNDDLSEPDEALLLELSNPSGAVLGKNFRHRHEIQDDDRSLLINVVRDFGAIGDSVTDDTQAIQEAIDRARLSSGSVVQFPPGTYAVGELTLASGVNYYGYGATLLRLPGQPTDAHTLVLRHAGDTDSELTLIQGLTLDGNRDEQGDFTDWQYENSDLLRIEADASRRGRTRFVGEDLWLQATGGNGVWLGSNVDGALCHLQGDNVWTDLIKVGGGNGALRARGVVARGDVGTTGIAVDPEVQGFEGTYRVDVELEQVEMYDGDLEISVEESSSVVGQELRMAEAPLYVRAEQSRVQFTDSTFYVGPTLQRLNRFVAPNDVLFQRSEFIVTEAVGRTFPQEEEDRELMAAFVSWANLTFGEAEDDPGMVGQVYTGQSLVFEDCDFSLDADVEASDSVYVAGTDPRISADDSTEPNRIIVRGGTMSSDFDDLFAPECSECIDER